MTRAIRPITASLLLSNQLLILVKTYEVERRNEIGISTTVNITILVFWVAASCNFVGGYQRFGVTCESFAIAGVE
jgi:hypothetical protein